jgi:hypothetical protein
MSNYIEHLEYYLGKVNQTFEPIGLVDKRPFQVLSFRGTPVPEATTIATAGLSGHILEQPRGPKIRQEFVACTYHKNANEEFAGIIDHVGRQILLEHKALLRGEVLGPAGPIVPGSTLEALLCASPWYWEDDGFSRYSGLTPAVLIVWLVPISCDEANFIQNNGIDVFEDLIAKREPDLFDLGRLSIV